MGNLRLCVLWPMRWNVGLDREKPAVLIGAGPAIAGGGGKKTAKLYKWSQTIHCFQTAANYVSTSTN